MSGFEERIMELIRQLREEIRMNDQRIKQLSGGSGGGVDLTALMLKAIYDQDEDGVVDNSKRLDGYTLEEILSQSGGGSGDMTKAVYDIDDDGVVDNAEKLDGHPASDFALANHNHDEDDIILSDIATNNVSTERHGFCPKLPNDSSKFLNGVGSWAAPPAGRNIIIDENFDGLVTGNIEGQGSYDYASAWSVPSDGGSAQVHLFDENNKCLRIYSPSGISQNAKVFLNNKFGATPGCRISYSMMITQDVAGVYGSVLLADNTGGARVSVRFRYNSGLKISAYNGSSYTDIMAASKNTWYRVDILYHPAATGYYLVWIDGEYKGVYSAGSVSAGSLGLKEIRIYCTSPSGYVTDYYVDDLFVEVYHPLEAA